MSIVLGEAPETDSEEEIIIPSSYKKICSDGDSSKTQLNPNVILKGENIVDGQTEPGQETLLDLISTPVGKEATETFTPLEDTSPISESLRQYLNDVSYQFLSSFIQANTIEASRKLIESDQTLLKSQITLQNASMTIKFASQKFHAVEQNLRNLINDDFIPNIKLRDDPVIKS